MYCEECGFSCNCEPRELILLPPISLKEAEDYLLKVLEWEEMDMHVDEEDKYIEAINGARRMRYNYWHVIK